VLGGPVELAQQRGQLRDLGAGGLGLRSDLRLALLQPRQQRSEGLSAVHASRQVGVEVRTGHHIAHRPVHPGDGKSRAVFVVADQAPIQHQDPGGLLHNPPLGLRDEPGIGRIALHDLHVDAHLLAVVHDRLLETLVDQGFLHGVGEYGLSFPSAAGAAVLCHLPAPPRPCGWGG
jgi:hypothetical protein